MEIFFLQVVSTKDKLKKEKDLSANRKSFNEKQPFAKKEPLFY